MAGPVSDPRAAALLRSYLDAFGGPEIPVPVEAIAEDFVGLRVAETGGLDCSGLLIPAERRIWVNAREAAQSPARRRFTIAHELGHWVCQVLEGRWKPVFCRMTEVVDGVGAGLDRPGRGEGAPAAAGDGHARPGRYPPEEREANVFAAELLMPEPAVRAAFEEDDSVEGLARRFGVSEEAMRWRLFNFQLVTERPA